jgi:endonuclease/exonuclease/phosphatase family metal-dependent hydrolase
MQAVRVLLLVLAALLACAPRLRAENSSADNGFVLTVATFNVHHPASSDPETVEAVGQTGADMIFLQEVTPSWREVLERRYGDAYPHRWFAVRGGAGGLGILSRFPLEEARVLPPPIKHPAGLVRVKTPAGDVQVLNLHLRSVFTGDNVVSAFFSVGDDHVQELRAYFPHLRRMPTLIVGDLNENPGAAATGWLKDRGFVDALPRHRRNQYTWRTLGGSIRLALDHILFDSTFESLDAWVMPGGDSDHLPVVARLLMKRRLEP